jgi:hypothetical protein
MSQDTKAIAIADLYKEYGKQLQLQWLAGHDGGAREILPESMISARHHQ